MNKSNVIFSVFGIIFIIGVCAYIGFIVARRNEKNEKTNIIVSTIGGGMIGFGICLICYGVIKKREEKMNSFLLTQDQPILSRYSRFVQEQ